MTIREPLYVSVLDIRECPEGYAVRHGAEGAREHFMLAQTPRALATAAPRRSEDWRTMFYLFVRQGLGCSSGSDIAMDRAPMIARMQFVWEPTSPAGRMLRGGQRRWSQPSWRRAARAAWKAMEAPCERLDSWDKDLMDCTHGAGEQSPGEEASAAGEGAVTDDRSVAR